MPETQELVLPLSSAQIEGGEAILAAEQERKADKRLQGTALQATVWTVFAYGSSQSLRMLNSVILTRMLLPEFFGLMALVSTLILGLRLLSDVGLLPSIISSSRGDEGVFLDTAWTLQILRGFCLWSVAVLLAWPASRLYHDHRLLFLIPVLGFNTCIEGFASTNLLSAARHLGVRRLLTIDLMSQVVMTLVMIAWAMVRPSIWALIAGNIAYVGFKTCVSHVPRVLPGRKNHFAWEPEALQSLVHFGKWILLGTGFFFLASQADRLLLGRLISFAMLGVYGVAFTMSDIPRQIISQFAYRVGYPFVAKLKSRPFPDFRRQVLKYRLYALLCGALLLACVTTGGGLLVHRIYDARYRDATWMVPLLALGLWHTLMYNCSQPVLLSLGKPKYNAIGTGCFCVFIFTALPIAFHYRGLPGAVFSVAIGDLPYFFVIEFGMMRQKMNVWKQDALATMAFLVFLCLAMLLRHLFTGTYLF